MNGRRPVGTLLAVVVAAAALAGCSRSGPPSVGRLVVDGQAEVSRAGEERREVTGTRTLRAGDRVRVLQGTADIRLPENRRVELRLGSELELAPDGTSKRARPALLAGDALLTSGDSPLVVSLGGPEVTVTGVARASRGLAVLVATYRGSAVLRSSGGGRSIDVPALRQGAIPAAGTFPDRPTPLEASATDSWDQRFLSDAIELGGQLASRSQAFSAQLGPTDGRSAAYFRSLFPQLATEPAFDPSLVKPSRLPGETLIGASVALEGTRGGFGERWAAVFAFHEAGASWGLVALDQGVDRVPLLRTIEAAIARTPATFAGEPPGSGPTSLPPPSGPGAPAVTVPARTTTTLPRGRTPGPTTTAPSTRPPTPTTTVPPGPLNTGSPVIDDTVNSLVDTLTGLLRSLGQ
jgi:hypothetical protein